MYEKLKTRMGIALQHVLFWGFVWLFFFYMFSYNSENRIYIIWFSSLMLPLTIAITYFAIYFLIPRYLLKKKYRAFFLYTFYTLVFSSYMIVLIIYGSLILIMKWDASDIPPMIKNYIFILILVYLIVGGVSLVTILQHHFRNEKINRDLENKILSTQLKLREQELEYLKKQIHPHFLFNALNTIYGYALKNSERTSDLILKLSGLLDYILYQVEQPRVNLKSEIEHIRDYIELEKTRFEERLEINMEVSGDVSRIHIAPMLILPYVENALKHGTPEQGKLRIIILISVKGKHLTLNVKNSYSGPDHIDHEKGIGLQNLRKRLELHYPDNYLMKQSVDKGIYCSSLEIFNLELHEKR